MAYKNKKMFREAFTMLSKDVTKWFPRHMYKGLKQMQAKLKNIDLIIEIHDARIPFSGRNPMFESHLTQIRPHVLVLNKIDLADLSQKKDIEEHLKKEKFERVLFANCKAQNDKGVKEILPLFKSIIERDKDNVKYKNRNLFMMVIGIPNVGKSTFINALRIMHTERGKGAPVGALPGMTKCVMEKIVVCEHPKIYLFDTPGVLSPVIKDVDVGLKLALCGTIQDHLLGEDIIADYLLYWLNKNQNYSYVNFLNLKEPSDDINEVLIQSAVHLGKMEMHKSVEGSLLMRPNLHFAACHFVKGFREGKLGKVMLDENVLKNISYNN